MAGATTAGRRGGRLRSALLLVAAALPALAGGAPVVAAPIDGPPPDELEARLSQALASSDLEAARGLAEAAIAGRRPGLSDSELADYLDELAARFYEHEALEHAEDLFERELDLRRRADGGDTRAVAEVLAALSTVAFERGRYAAAEGYENDNLRILAAQPDVTAFEIAGREVDLGWILFKQGRYRETDSVLDRALPVLRKAGDRAAETLVYAIQVQAELRRVQNRFAEAGLLLEEALARLVAAAVEDQLLWATDLRNSLAGVAKDLGRYAEAEALLREVIGVWQGDAEAMSRDLSTGVLNLAEVFRLQGRVDDALPLYERALGIARQGDDPEREDDPELPVFLNQLAVAYAEAGRPGRAETLYREALTLLERSPAPNRVHLAQSAHDLGALLRQSGQLAAAEGRLRQALAIRRSLFGPEHPEVAATLTQLATTLRQGAADGHAEASRLLESALAIFSATTAYPREHIDALVAQRDLRRARGDLAGATASALGAIELVETLRPEVGGEAARADFLSRYAPLFAETVDLHVEAGDLAAAVGLAERGRARALLDQLALARVDLRAGMPVESLRPIEMREAELKELIAENQARLAAIYGATDPSAEPVPGSFAEPAPAGIAELEGELDEALGELRRIALAIQRGHPLWRQLITAGGRLLSAAEIQDALPAGSLMLLYQIGPERSHVFALAPPPARPAHWQLTVSAADAAALGGAPGALTDAVLSQAIAGEAGRSWGLAARLGRTRGLQPDAPAGAAGQAATPEHGLFALWRTLVPAELWRRVLAASEVLVIPDGALHLLPFAALVTRLPDGQGAERYWIDEGPALRYAASATVEHNLAERPPRGSGEASMLLVADPVFGPPGEPAGATGKATAGAAAGPAGRLRRLPGTAAEAAAIRRLWQAGGADLLPLERHEASEARLRAALGQSPAYLHFATHGLVDRDRHELLAALALAPPAGEVVTTEDDGLLQLFEIYGLRLDAELAVLSACESHVGRLVRGEGVFALSTGFLAAGARRVVASHWAVDDESTAALMAAFYRELRRAGAADPHRFARALRDAQREVRNDPRWSAPYHWAPFFLSGR